MNLPNRPTLTSMKIVELDHNHHNQTVTATLDSLLTVRLSENPTTGYRWTIEDADNQYIHLLKSDFEVSDELGIGSGGQRIITLQFLRRGKYHLKLLLKRVWEQSYEDDFQVNLIIQ